MPKFISRITVPNHHQRPTCRSAVFSYKTVRGWQQQVKEETGKTPTMQDFLDQLVEAVERQKDLALGIDPYLA